MFKDISHHIAKYAGAALVIAVGFGVFTVSVQGMGGKFAFNLPQLPMLAESALAQVSGSVGGNTSTGPVTPFVFTVLGAGPNQSGVTTLRSGDDVTLFLFTTRPSKQATIERVSVLVSVDGANINQAVDSFKLFQTKNNTETLLSEVQATKYKTNSAYVTFENADTGMIDGGAASYVVKADIINPKPVSSSSEFDVNDRLSVNLQSVAYRVSTSIVEQQFNFTSAQTTPVTTLTPQLVSSNVRTVSYGQRAGESDRVEFNLKTRLTASGGHVYIPKDAFLKFSNTSNVTKLLSSINTIDGSDRNDTRDFYVIKDGESRVVTHTQIREATATTNERVTLDSIRWKGGLDAAWEYRTLSLNYSSQYANINVVPGVAAPITVEPTSSNISLVLGDTYRRQFISSNHKEASEWSISKGSLPNGLTLKTTGAFAAEVVGTPTSVGEYNFTVRATDKTYATARYAESQVSITVKPQALKISPVSFTRSYTAGERVNQQFFGESQHVITSWTVSEGKLPSGVTLTKTGAFTASLVGTTTKAGTFNFTIKAGTTDGSSALVPVSIIVTEPAALSMSLAQTPSATVFGSIDGRDRGVFNIVYEVNAGSQDIYLPRVYVTNATSTANIYGNAFEYKFSASTPIMTYYAATSVDGTKPGDTGTSYLVKAGTTRYFNTQVQRLATQTVTDRLVIKGIKYGTKDGVFNQVYTTTSDFMTPVLKMNVVPVSSQ